MSTNTRPWTRGEKALLWGSIAALVIGIGWSMWVNYVNSDPVIDIPTPSTPNPNAFDYFVSAGNNVAVGWPMPGSRPPLTNPRANMAPRVKDPDLRDPKVMAAALVRLQRN